MKHQALLIGALLVAAACNNDITGLGPPSDPATETFAASLGVNIPQMSKTTDGVYYRDLLAGTGPTVSDSAVSITVNYAGYLKDGKLFESKNNIVLTLSTVVPGFRSGLLGAKEGGRRKLVIPSELGYGHVSRKNAENEIIIPRQSTLIFDIDVLKVTNPTKPAT